MKVLNSQKVTAASARELFSQGLMTLGSVVEAVQKIIMDVKTRGDHALVEYTEKFDGFRGSPGTLLVRPSEIQDAYNQVSQSFVEALRRAKENIATFHAAQLRPEWHVETQPGVKVGQIWRPLESVGLYAPGGRAAYPSSVLMAAVPAKVAGVKTLVLATPPNREGKVNPGVLVAARESGVDTVIRAGGAQVIAAFAFGTEKIPRVQKIVGPGNKYVTAAKQLVSSEVAIDLPAGPSEILILVDDTTKLEYAVLDLFSQVEHDPDNLGVLAVTSPQIAVACQKKIEEMLPTAPRREIIQSALDSRGLIIICPSELEMVRIANLMGAEHLEILAAHPYRILQSISNAGAIFLGPNSPVPLGDFSAGSNHVLPTGGYSRQYSGLNSFDFVKLISIVECSLTGLRNCGPTAIEIAKFEGFNGHAASISERLKKVP
ncbi:MAG: histidinol dehydrogenase HisD [Promethearchaeota archaeon CR_4]|nr:MAG: histidinol dehydrogenase HisD [Candidatus Lokiarchaeota archaeon CR_4]